MEIVYTCSCTREEITVTVPYRVGGTDILAWMGVIQRCIGYDHSARSPTCLKTTVEYAKIPIVDHAAPVGEKPKPLN